MSLEEILKDIELRGENELKELNSYYEKKLSDLQAKQDVAIKSQNEKIKKSSEEERRTAERTIISSAEMEALNTVRSRESQLISEAAEKAELYLKNIRSRKDYPEVLSRMVQVAQKTLGEDCTIYAAKSDAATVNRGKSKVVEKEVDPFGGIVAESSDGSRELDLTITAVISEIREKLVSRLYEYLGE